MPRAREVIVRAAPGFTAPPAPSADKISAEEFRCSLVLYDFHIKPRSDSKGSKPGEKTLSELDNWRYGDAINEFSGEKPRREMELEDVKTLVNWKLKHGKFRPTLMKLVSSNDPGFVKETVQEASRFYWEKSDVSGALKILTKLRGIGPATASLLLAVLDPDHIIFFADEAFHWLCCDGKEIEIKYNAKEYEALMGRTRELCKRLNVRAVDVERVAYVMMIRQGLNDKKGPEEKGREATRTEEQEEPTPQAAAKRAKLPQPAKRKARSDEDQEAEKKPTPAPERRSKRIQNAKEA